MATPTTPRHAHVKRVFQLNDDGSINTNVWIDLLRIDKTPMNRQSTGDGIQGQIAYYKLLWNDDPNNPLQNIDNSDADIQGENANVRSRKTEKIQVKNPQSPDQAIDLWVIKMMSMRDQPERTGKVGQINVFKFHNSSPQSGASDANTRRIGSVVHVVNNDLGGMKMAADDGSDPILVDWNDYEAALQAGAEDGSQYLDVFITDKFWVSFAPEESGARGQIIQFVLGNNREVEQLFERGDSNAVDIDGAPSVVWTDPLQSIVNVGFVGGAVFVVGDFGGASGFIQAKTKKTISPLALGQLAFTANGQIFSGTYAKVGGPVFLMGGTTDQFGKGIQNERYPGGPTGLGVQMLPTGYAHGIIVASKDGKTWKTVLDLQIIDPFTGAPAGQNPPTSIFQPRVIMALPQVLGITWTGNEFYAGVHMVVLSFFLFPELDFVIPETRLDEIDLLLASADGFSWTQAGSRQATVTKGQKLPQTGLLCQYCSSKITDTNNNPVPDGIYHYSKDSRGNEVFIHGDAVPTINWQNGGINVNVAASTLTIEKTVNGQTTTTTVTPPIPFLVVAYAAGTILVAGAQIAISTDWGKTWTTDGTYSGLFPPATTALAAPLGDFKST